MSSQNEVAECLTVHGFHGNGKRLHVPYARTTCATSTWLRSSAVGNVYALFWLQNNGAKKS